MNKMTSLLMLFTSSVVIAGSPVTSDIEWVGQRGNGNIIIKFKDVVEQEHCSNREIEISENNPAAHGMLSIAMSAYHADVKVTVKTDSCSSSGTPAITGNGFIHLKAK